MKKIFAVLVVLLASVAFVFAGGASDSSSENNNVIRVGATPEPHAALLNLVVDDLASQGYTLEIVDFTDYVTPNTALEAGELDANYFQHIPYLDTFNVEQGTHLVNAGGIHIEPIALYSTKYDCCS